MCEDGAKSRRCGAHQSAFVLALTCKSDTPPTAFTALCVPSLPLCCDVELTVVFFGTKPGENIQAGNCNSVVEKLADYLKENNY